MNTPKNASAVEELLALFIAEPASPAEKDAFFDAFKTRYPQLSQADRDLFLTRLHEYLDSILIKKSPEPA